MNKQFLKLMMATLTLPLVFASHVMTNNIDPYNAWKTQKFVDSVDQDEVAQVFADFLIDGNSVWKKQGSDELVWDSQCGLVQDENSSQWKLSYKIYDYVKFFPKPHSYDDKQEVLIPNEVKQSLMATLAEEAPVKFTDLQTWLAFQQNNPQTLTVLHLVYKHITAEGAQAIAKTLKGNTSLRALDLSKNRNIEAEGAQAIAKALKGNTSLRVLNLSDNGIGFSNACIKAIAEALEVNTSLKVLNLSENRGLFHRHIGIQTIAKALKKNSSLKELDLSHNGLGYNEEVQALAEILKGNSTLRVLNLAGNVLNAVGARTLRDALKRNTSLRELNLSSNGIGFNYSSLKAIAEALEVNTSLRVLNLRDNHIDYLGDDETIAKVLRKNTSLQVLDLSNNLIGLYYDSDIKAIAEALKINTSLRTLDLKNNRIGDEGIKLLQEAVANKVNFELER